MRSFCLPYSGLDTQAHWFNRNAKYYYRLCFRAHSKMRSIGVSNRSSAEWADDWTEALDGPLRRNNDSDSDAAYGSSPQCAPSLGSKNCAGLQNLPFLRSLVSVPDMAQYGKVERLLLSPHVMHYSSVTEQYEWAAVLDAREEQTALLEPFQGSEAPRATAVIPMAPPPVQITGLHGAAAANVALEVPRAAAAASRAATAGRGGIEPTNVNAAEDDICLKKTAPARESVAAPLQPAIAAVAVSSLNNRSSRDGCNTDGLLVAIELGSHCTRALLHDGRSELARLTYDTMLGQNVSHHSGDCSSARDFHPEALQRTLCALQQIMAEVLAAAAVAPPSPPSTMASQAAVKATAPVKTVLSPRSVGQPRIVARMVATAAVRDTSSSSRAALVAAAERLTGCSLEILTGEDEGRLAWRGVVCGLQSPTPPRQSHVSVAEATAASASTESVCRDHNHQHQQHLLVVDMGGRSTEFVYGAHKADRPAAVSVPLGCVGLHSAACELEQSCAPFKNGLTVAVRQPGATGGGGNCGQDCGSALSVFVPRPEDVEPSLEALEACVRLAQETVQRVCRGMPWMPPKSPMAATTTEAEAGARSKDPACNPWPMDTQKPSAGGGNGGCAVGVAAGCAAPSSLVYLLQNCSTEETSMADVIFTGGTVTTLAALHQQLPYYDRSRVHGSVLTFGDIAALMVHLADAEERAAALRTYGWLTEARCRTLAAGCAGLLGVMAALGLERVAVSDADLLDGLLAEILDSYTLLR
ncbi:hypothetical protein VaNZ11_011161 [Volvox africanus]|uniref:Ppx/GppA phosphatase N-terminal domain-containing protein n=1 Tax=Volvox africanus TaxID=51714 RepID=A0ABQ5SC57_9CHLO|nr:hypothetical protein VaNZ11_011161 [Volvox africanus]